MLAICLWSLLAVDIEIGSRLCNRKFPNTHTYAAHVQPHARRCDVVDVAVDRASCHGFSTSASVRVCVCLRAYFLCIQVVWLYHGRALKPLCFELDLMSWHIDTSVTSIPHRGRMHTRTYHVSIIHSRCPSYTMSDPTVPHTIVLFQPIYNIYLYIYCIENPNRLAHHCISNSQCVHGQFSFWLPRSNAWTILLRSKFYSRKLMPNNRKKNKNNINFIVINIFRWAINEYLNKVLCYSYVA